MLNHFCEFQNAPDCFELNKFFCTVCPNSSLSFLTIYGFFLCGRFCDPVCFSLNSLVRHNGARWLLQFLMIHVVPGQAPSFICLVLELCDTPTQTYTKRELDSCVIKVTLSNQCRFFRHQRNIRQNNMLTSSSHL